MTFDANTSVVTDNGDGTYTITNADGTTVTIDTPGDVLTELQDNTSDIYNEIQTLITARKSALHGKSVSILTETRACGTIKTNQATNATTPNHGSSTTKTTNATSHNRNI